MYALRYLNTNLMDIVKQKIKVHLPFDTAIMLDKKFEPIRVFLCEIFRQSNKKHKTNFLPMLSYGTLIEYILVSAD